MVSGAHKVWTNAVLRTGPAAMLGRSLFCLNKAKLGESLSHALARRSAETERLKAALLTFACIERFIRVPEPAVFIRKAVGEMAGIAWTHRPRPEFSIHFLLALSWYLARVFADLSKYWCGVTHHRARFVYNARI